MKSLNADGYDTHGTSQPETAMSQTANSRTWLRLRLPCWTAQQHNQLSTLFPFRFRSWEDSNKMYNKEVSLQCSQFKYEPSTKKDRKASLGNKSNKVNDLPSSLCNQQWELGFLVYKTRTSLVAYSCLKGLAWISKVLYEWTIKWPCLRHSWISQILIQYAWKR